MTGTSSRTARVPTARWDLKEAAGKPPNRGTRSTYEACSGGPGSVGFRTLCHPNRLCVYVTGLGRRSRVLPWEICIRAVHRAGPHRKVWSEECRSQPRARKLPQQPKARTSNPEPMPSSR